MKEKSKKVLHTNYRIIHVSWLSTDQVGLSNNNPHWNLGFRFLFYPDLIQVLRDLKVTHPSLERLTHPSLERLESDSSKSWETWKWLIKKINLIQVPHVLGFGEGTLQKTGILQFFYRSGKSAQGLWNTPPSPTFGALLNPVKGLVGKEVFTLEKILPWRRGQLQSHKGIEDRVSSKIWVD